MMMRFDPFRELDRLTQHAPDWFGRLPGMALDAYRDGERVVAHFDLPGVDPESIDLTAERNVLTVSAERRFEPQEGDRVLASERPQGTFSRQLLLGEGLDTDRIEATYDNGVLTVVVPVAEQAKVRRVQVTSGGSKAEAIETGSTAA